MTDQQKIKNIISFLAILFGESKIWWEEIMKFHPDYLIEKFDRYINSTRHESNWGLHMTLRKDCFEHYCQKYQIPFEQFEEIG